VTRVRFSTSELKAHLGGERVGPDVSIEGASIDSRTIRAGQLYAPIVAERDGHAFIPAALDHFAPQVEYSRPALHDDQDRDASDDAGHEPALPP